MRSSEGFRIGDGSLARHRGLYLASQHPPANEPLPGQSGGGFAFEAALDASDRNGRRIHFPPLIKVRVTWHRRKKPDALGITEGAGLVFSNQEHERRPPPCREATADHARARQRLSKRRASRTGAKQARDLADTVTAACDAKATEPRQNGDGRRVNLARGVAGGTGARINPTI